MTTFSNMRKVEESKISEILEIEDDKNLETECPICMRLMVEPCRLPCEHVYCAYCTQTFLVNKRECPMDRKKIADSWKITVDRALQEKIFKLDPE